MINEPGTGFSGHPVNCDDNQKPIESSDHPPSQSETGFTNPVPDAQVMVSLIADYVTCESQLTDCQQLTNCEAKVFATFDQSSKQIFVSVHSKENVKVNEMLITINTKLDLLPNSTVLIVEDQESKLIIDFSRESDAKSMSEALNSFQRRLRIGHRIKRSKTE